MKRAIIIVLDGCGVGALPDADLYGDLGANTLYHVIEKAEPRLNNLGHLGLYALLGIPWEGEISGAYGKAIERSFGKDTTSGHWEMAGLLVDKPFPTFPGGFPRELMEKFTAVTGLDYLGNEAASGTEIIQRLGREHMRTGNPIVYTSADSVFQIAAHEDIISPEKLWEICEKSRAFLVDDWAVGRVIARPFTGDRPGHFQRTGNRRDFSVEPFGPTLLSVMKDAGLDVWGVGKIEDIFAHKGLTLSRHSAGNAACQETMLEFIQEDFHGLMFVNLVDFDSLWGHRRDIDGFAKALEESDVALGELMAHMREEDLLIVCADHGVDPSYKGTDHTREYIPVLAWARGIHPADLGIRGTYADIARTIAEYFAIDHTFPGKSFLGEIL